MIKYFCDICKQEMNNQEEGGMMTIRERKLEFLKHKAEQQLVQIQYLFCPSCSNKIRDYKKTLEKNE